MNEPHIDTLTQRLDRLERENRWWKIVGSTAVIVLGLAVLLGATGSKVAEEMRAKRFVLVAQDGRTSAELGLTRGGYPRLALYQAGAFTTSLAPGSLALYDQDGTERAALKLWLDVPRAGLTAEPTAVPHLRLSDQDGTLRAVLGTSWVEAPRTGTVEQRPASSLVLFDKHGKVIWKAP